MSLRKPTSIEKCSLYVIYVTQGKVMKGLKLRQKIKAGEKRQE